MAGASDDRTNRLVRWPSLLLAVGLVAAVEVVIKLEWSSPACNDPQDGPVSAVFGAPLPYERFSGGHSMHYYFVPHLYLLNLLFLSAIAWPLVLHVGGRAARRWPQLTRGGMALAGALLCAAVNSLHVFEMAMEEWSPVMSLAQTPDETSYEPYRGLRPVGVSIGRHYDCTRSTFWFALRARANRISLDHDRLLGVSCDGWRVGVPHREIW
jgi:hypothetical protein